MTINGLISALEAQREMHGGDCRVLVDHQHFDCVTFCPALNDQGGYINIESE
jgi:hypothetical protein